MTKLTGKQLLNQALIQRKLEQMDAKSEKQKLRQKRNPNTWITFMTQLRRLPQYVHLFNKKGKTLLVPNKHDPRYQKIMELYQQVKNNMLTLSTD